MHTNEDGLEVNCWTMMNYKRGLLNISAVGLLAALSLPAQPALGAAPEISFHPVQTWAPAQGGAASTCTIGNEFNNGFIVIFTGADKKLQALNIDFRQAAFENGSDVPLTISTPDQNSKTLNGRAVSTEKISIPLGGHHDLFNSMRKTGVMDLNILGNAFRFYLTGLPNGLGDFDSCLGYPPGTPYPAVKSVPETADMAEMQDPDAPETGAADPQEDESITPSPENAAAPAQDEEIIFESTTHKTPGPKVVKESIKAEIDVTGSDLPERNVDEIDAITPGITKDMRQIVALESKIKMLNEENKNLNAEVEQLLKTGEKERMDIASDNWNLENATMKYNEAERQINRLGKQIQKERARCEMEKKELELMLFDPELTEKAQLASLAKLEKELAEKNAEIDELKLKYETRIKQLQGGL